MTLLFSLGALCAVAAYWFVASSAGAAILRLCRIPMGDELERLLTATAVGTALFLVLVAIAQSRVGIRQWIAAAFVALALVGIAGCREVWSSLNRLAGRARNATTGQQLVYTAIGAVAAFEALCAVAPLTGSDALHYHFAAPLVWLRGGYQPNFFLPHSFLTGQNHLFILAGLAVGSEKFALGLLFLGGVLAAAASFCLAKQWASGIWPGLAALAFLLTPVVFWQITSSGAPDLWMAFFAPLGVRLIARVDKNVPASIALVAGICAGAVAGGKYTGILIAGSMAIALVAQTRSLLRIVLFFLGALAAGIWPYARNWAWTGDPLFPFGGRLFQHAQENSFALALIRGDTGAAGQHVGWPLAAMPFFAAFDSEHAGFWQFFGPLCLIFAPLPILAWRKTALWRSAVIIWMLSSVAIAVTSGMARFLLPVFPVAMAAAMAGAYQVQLRNWRVGRWFATISIGGFLLLGCGGLLLYGRQAAKASVGMISREDYLRQRAPDYGKSEFVNRSLQDFGGGTALVFFRHLYYLRVPYAYGDPGGSWPVDPDKLRTSADWREFLRREHIRWIVRSPDYPQAIAAPLRELEAAGTLVPYARGRVEDIEGMRMLGARSEVEVTIFLVMD
jgi:hypothetical protein